MMDRFMSNRSTETNDQLTKQLGLLKPQLDALAAAADAKRVQEQRAPIPDLERLQGERKAEIPALENDVRKLSETEKRLHGEWQEAVKANSAAKAKLSLRSSWYTHQENLLWAKIRDHASPVIVERQKKWRDLIDEARLKVESEERRTTTNLFGIWHTIFESNVLTVQRRIDVITEGIKTAEQMKFEPLEEKKIIEKLDAIEKTFPPLTNEREIKTVKAPDISQWQSTSW